MVHSIFWRRQNAEGVARLVITSTSETYGTAQYTPIDEAHPSVAQSPYAATKVAADQLALSYYRSFDTPVSVVRPFVGRNFGSMPCPALMNCSYESTASATSPSHWCKAPRSAHQRTMKPDGQCVSGMLTMRARAVSAARGRTPQIVQNRPTIAHFCCGTQDQNGYISHEDRRGS